MIKSLLAMTLMFIILYSGATGTVKYNPGHYATLQNNFTRSDLQDVLNTPGLKGVQLRYTWKSIETSEGVYDFSKIFKDKLNLFCSIQNDSYHHRHVTEVRTKSFPGRQFISNGRRIVLYRRLPRLFSGVHLFVLLE